MHRNYVGQRTDVATANSHYATFWTLKGVMTMGIRNHTIKILTLTVAALALVAPAHAVLQGRTIDGAFVTASDSYFLYDTVLNVTWLRDTSYMATSGVMAVAQNEGYVGGASMSTTQNALQSLLLGGVSGWRLPTATAENYSEPDYHSPSVAGEIGYLFYQELGNTIGSPTKLGAFQNWNVKNGFWSSSVSLYEPPGYPGARVENYLIFGHDELGNMTTFPTRDGFYRPYNAMIVHDGDIFSSVVAEVPEPESYAMLMTGLGMLGVVSRRKKKLM